MSIWVYIPLAKYGTCTHKCALVFRLAQLVARLPSKQKVEGSIPSSEGFFAAIYKWFFGATGSFFTTFIY